MTHEDLLLLWEKDAEIDRHKLDDESLHVPKLHHKYLSIYLDIKSKKIALIHRLENLKKEKELYYSGQATSDVYKEQPFDLKLKTKSGVEKHVNTDPEVNKLIQRIEYMDVLIDGVQHIMDQIKWRSSSIKNAIDYQRFTSGGL
jgi:hypothetical protein